MPESLETIIARIDERQKAQIQLQETQNAMTSELFKIIKGDNGEGLMTKVAKTELVQKNCPKPQVDRISSSVKWLIWGFRVIVVAIIGGFFWFIRSGVK